MPADKKKAASEKGSDNKPAMKLHATAKEFVPSAVSHSSVNTFSCNIGSITSLLQIIGYLYSSFSTYQIIICSGYS